jgi:DNA-binding NtrC family response regulator
MIQSRILVVDDEPGMVSSLQDLLEDYGHIVETADSGYEALDRIKETSYSFVLMDVRMPGINGVETLRKIKQIDPNCTVVMMTAYSLDELLAEAIELGAYSVFYKPLNIEKLVDVIQEVEEARLVLVVDDDSAMRESLLDNLESYGLHVVTAKNGQEALEKVKESDVGVVLLDVLLPIMNGLELYQKLKEIRPGIKVVLITGQRSSVGDLVSQAIDESVYGCLYKPFDVGLLAAVIHSMIQGKTKSEVQTIITSKPS